MTQWILTSSLLIAAVLLIRALGRDRLSARLRYALWALVLLRLLIPVSIGESSLSVQNWLPAEAPQTEPTATVERPYREVNVPPVQPSHTTNTSEMLQTTQTSETAQTTQINALREEISIAESPAQPLRLLPMLWIAGVLTVGGVFLVSNLRFALLLRRSRRYVGRDTLPVYVTAAIETPCLFGVLRPAVYMTPDVLTDDRTQRHVLAHELTHYRHGDHLWSLLRCVCVTLHWYNPLVWIAAVLSQKDGELACDEGALQKIGDSERTDYAHTLLDLTCVGYGGLLTAATSMTGSESDLKTRVLRIVKNPKMSRYAIPVVLVLGAVIALAMFTGEKRSLEGLWRSEDLRYYEREGYVTDAGSIWDDNWDVPTYEELDFRGDMVRITRYRNMQASGPSCYPYTLEDDQIQIETGSFNLDGTPYIRIYTWDKQQGTLSYYNEHTDYTYTLRPCEQTDNGVLPYGDFEMNYVVSGEQMVDFRYLDFYDSLLDAIRTSAAERVNAQLPQEPAYEIHFTCDGERGVCYVSDELFYIDGRAYRLSKMPLVLQALQNMSWVSNQPLTDAAGRLYYTHPQPELCEVSMWYGENRYYVFDKQAEFEEEMERIRPFAVAERPELPMEEHDHLISVRLEEYSVLVYPCGWVYDQLTDRYFAPEHTAGICALLAPYRFMVEDFRVASALWGSWEAVQGGDSAADMTVYTLSAANGFGTRTTYCGQGRTTEQFALEVLGNQMVFTFEDGTRKLYTYASEGSTLTLTAEDEMLVLENLQHTLYESYREHFDIIRRRSGQSEPMSMTEAEKQHLVQLLLAGIPDEETDENIIYSDECTYDLYGITLPGVKSNITLSDRGKLFFDGENYLLTNAAAVLDYINGLYAQKDGYGVTDVYIVGNGTADADPLLAELGQRVVLDAMTEPKEAYVMDPCEWSVSDEDICELRCEENICWVTGRQPGTVTVTLRCGSFTDTFKLQFVDEW